MRFHGIAAIHRAAAFAELAALLLGSVRAEDDIFRVDADVRAGMPTQNWWVVQMFSTLGIPTRIPERSLGGDAGVAAEALLCGTMSAMLGNAFLVFSIPALITFISFRSSTKPLGQELFTITRSQPFDSGTLLHSRPLPPGNSTSMKLRWQVTGHQLHTVSLAVVVL